MYLHWYMTCHVKPTKTNQQTNSLMLVFKSNKKRLKALPISLSNLLDILPVWKLDGDSCMSLLLYQPNDI